MAIIQGTNGADRISTTRTVPGQPFATDFDDVLNGYGGDDHLDGGPGADAMTGGTGNDRYYVDDSGDVVTETSDQGYDAVYTTLSSYTLGASVEEVRFIGSGAFVGAGNELANKLVGGSGADTLIGGGGNDVLAGGIGVDMMIGGSGNDRYYVSNPLDVVSEAENEGSDEVDTTLSSYTLGANVEKLRFIGSGDFAGTGNELANELRGGSGADTLVGGAGDDRLYGGIGADVMIGGAGNDRYYVSNVADVVTEISGQGYDWVYTTLSSYTLGANLEYLKFIGTGDFFGTGNERGNKLYGGSGADTLVGAGGNDHLDGGAGTDVMAGGTGNDTYHVDEGGDAVLEAVGEGNDTIVTTVDYALIPGQSIENLRVSGSAGLSLAGNELDNSLYGGAGNDTLNGGAGNDKLYGGVGADLLAGGLGDDIYYVSNPSDIVFEEVGEGTDTVYTLTSYQLTAGYEVEILRVLGSEGLSLSGNEFDNTLYGGSGDDILDGGTGADRLEGGAGNDTLIDCECDFDDVLMGGDGMDFLLSGGGADQLSGGKGTDVFVYLETTDSTHDRRDTILDFKHGVDILDFSMLDGGEDDGNSFNPLVTVTTAPTTIDAHTLLAFVSGGDTILYVNNTDAAQTADAASMEILMQGLTTLTDSDLGYYVI